MCVSTCRNARLLLKLQYWVLIMAEINLSLTVLQRMRHPSIPIAGQCLNFEYVNDIPILTMLKNSHIMVSSLNVIGLPLTTFVASGSWVHRGS